MFNAIFIITVIFLTQGIKEGLRVNSDITTSSLSKLIRETMLPPLLEFCETVSFDINLMVLRETTNGSWVKVDCESTSEMEPYFGDRFLKPNARKKDGPLIFSAPANMKPPVFGLIFQGSVWKEIQVIKEAGVCWTTISHIFV